MPYSGLLQSESLPLWQATADPYLHRRHSNTFWLSLCGISGSWCTQALFEPSEHLWRVWGLILNVILPCLPPFWGFSFALGCGISFLGRIQHSPVDGYSATSCNFGVLTGEDEHTCRVHHAKCWAHFYWYIIVN